jgi:endonuclease/exonuclease/phosphatase family metal-dependent hydrolase
VSEIAITGQALRPAVAHRRPGHQPAAQLNQPDSPADQREQEPNIDRCVAFLGVRIVSVNAWGGALLDRLSAWLPTSSADVVCLQEVTRTPGLGGWTRFEDTERVLAQRANLFDDVGALLPHHRALFAASDAGPVADDAGRRHRQEFGLGTFVDERYPILDEATTFVHRAFIDHAEWPVDDRPRIAQALRLVDIDRSDRRAVTVVQVHGLRDRHGKSDSPARRAQAEQLAAFIAGVRGPQDLTVVCGDLNLLPQSETFEILGRLGLIDLVGTADARTSHYAKPVRHASYLLMSDPSVVERFAVLAEPEVSDHRALVLDI